MTVLVHLLAGIGAYALALAAFVGWRLWRTRRPAEPQPFAAVLDARRDALYPMRDWH